MSGKHGPIEERFWRHVHKTEGCWRWTGAISTMGYGVVNLGGRARHAHRVSWMLRHGDMPTAFVLHRCDNPSCVNPAHLFLGTQYDNMLDAARKGRIPRGDRHHGAKLTEAMVRSIRASTEPSKVVADRFGIHYSAVNQIRRRARWGWLS